MCTADSRTAVIFMLSDIVCVAHPGTGCRREPRRCNCCTALSRMNQMLFVSAVEPIGISNRTFNQAFVIRCGNRNEFNAF